jgi:hypothetical protein
MFSFGREGEKDLRGHSAKATLVALVWSGGEGAFANRPFVQREGIHRIQGNSCCLGWRFWEVAIKATTRVNHVRVQSHEGPTVRDNHGVQANCKLRTSHLLLVWPQAGSAQTTTR